MEDPGVVLLDFRALLEAAPDGIAVVDERGEILVVNDHMCELFGYSVEELVGNSVEALVPPRLREAHARHRGHYEENPTSRPMGAGLDLVALRKDGSEFPVEISLNPLISGQRRLTVAIVRDISEQRRLLASQRELREAIAGGREWPVLASILLEAAPIGCLVVDREAEILMVNAEIENLFGYDRQQLIGQKVDLLVPERLREAHIARREAYLRNPAVRQPMKGMVLTGLRQDGSEFPVEISLSPLETERGLLVITLVRDLTESHRLQEEQRALHSLLEIQQERYRIGMDLHDGIMQDIYAVSLGLGMAEQDIDSDPALAKQEVRTSVEQLHGVIRDIRSYIFDLRPRQFKGDLGHDLHDLAREFQEHSRIETNVHIVNDLPEVDHDIGVSLYVIAHEALSNTRKYAQASKVWISLTVEGGVLRMELRDDGCGFDPTIEIPESHHGLRNMASRASLVGAQLKVESAPGQGTAVKVELPLASSANH